jgi:hypothetical protein
VQILPLKSKSQKAGFTRAKTPRTPSSELLPFAAFATLREILRFSVAGQPHWDLRGEISAFTLVAASPR